MQFTNPRDDCYGEACTDLWDVEKLTTTKNTHAFPSYYCALISHEMDLKCRSPTQGVQSPIEWLCGGGGGTEIFDRGLLATPIRLIRAMDRYHSYKL